MVATASRPADVTLEPGRIDLQAFRTDAPRGFGALLEVLPFSLAVREAMRMRALATRAVLSTPVLDVGCGDGLFWEVVTRDHATGTEQSLAGLFGIDISDSELKLASLRLRTRGADVEVADISTNLGDQPLSRLAGGVRTVIANCSLEHVPRLDGALANIRDLLHPDGEFILFVPAPRWTDTFQTKRVLRRLGARVAGAAAGLLDGFFQHHHLYPAYVWRHLLEGAGFSDVTITGLGSPLANRLFETQLPPALLAFLVKSLHKRYPRARGTWPWRRAADVAAFIAEIEQGAFLLDDPTAPDVVEYFVCCRR